MTLMGPGLNATGIDGRYIKQRWRAGIAAPEISAKWNFAGNKGRSQMEFGNEEKTFDRKTRRR
jgi:hypothetical protein